ncbi:MAG: hypothetical protein PVF76_07800 [Syntrophobacterales bacterium]|jgi:hypothetical protein
MPAKEEHTYQAEERDKQILVWDIIQYCVSGKNGQEKLKEQ